MTGALDGIRVIDTSTGPVGGITTMVLADFGADVIKIEPPGGDRFRSLTSAPVWLRGKRSVVLDLRHERETLHDLVRGADVLVVSGPPKRAAAWGIDADAAERLQPSLVHCSITGWGTSGPLADIPAYDAIVAARSGRMMAFERQLRRGGPVFAALPVLSHAAAHGAVQGIASGLFARERTGQPQRVHTSLLQGALPYDLIDLLLVEVAKRTGVVGPGLASMGGDLPTLNYHPLLAADGRWIQCGNLLEHLFMSCLDAMGLLSEMLTDDRFVESPSMWSPDTIEVARNLMLERAMTKPADEWMKLFRENGNVAAEIFHTTAEALHHPDLVGNGDVVEYDDPHVGRMRTVGPIAHMTATPAAIRRPGPRVGEHTTEVLNELAPGARHEPHTGYAQVGEPTPPGRPLDGVVIVEFATIIAAPLATSLLADLGARVIRVEGLDGDPYRQLVPGGGPAVKTTAGKESICVDLKTAQGQAIADQLIQRADVLVHNYRPGVPERLGIGYDALRVRYPQLIWVAVNGYGPDGPGARRPATHPCAGAAMGAALYQAGVAGAGACTSLDDVREQARQLMRANESNPDPSTSVVVASAVTLALAARQRHGLGQAVFVNMMAANAHANVDDFIEYAGRPPRPAIDADMFGTEPGYRLYRTADGWVFLAATTDAEWRRFGDAVGPFESLEALFLTRSATDWEALLAAAGVACVQADESAPGPFFSSNVHVTLNGLNPPAEHARFGAYRRWGPLATVNGRRDRYGPGVLAGEHTDRLLSELGYEQAARLQLFAERIVASESLN